MNENNYPIEATPNREWLERGMSYAEFHLFRQYMSNLWSYPVEPCPVYINDDGSVVDEYDNIRLYRITQLVLDEKEDTTDKLASVYGAVHSIDTTLLLIIKSTGSEIEFYIGVKINAEREDGILKRSPSTAGMVLEGVLKSNFPGSELTPSLSKTEIESLMQEITTKKALSVSSVAVNPALRNDDKDRFVQGLEKLMDAFIGKKYTAYFIAQPLDKIDVEDRKRGYEQMYSALSPFAETTLSYGRNDSKTITENIARSFTNSINNGVSRSSGGSQNEGTNESTNESSGFSNPFFGNRSSGSSSGRNFSRGSNWSEGVTEGTSLSEGKTDSHGNAIQTGTSRNMSIKHTDKTVTRLLTCIDEHLEKIGSFESYGMWSCSAYFVSGDPQTSVAVANTFRALVLGDETRTEAFVNTWVTNNLYTPDLLKYISVGRHPLIRLPGVDSYSAKPVQPTSMVSGKELPIFLGFPRFSLRGLIVNCVASFGRAVSVTDNYKDMESSRKIRLGSIMHKGVIEQNNPVELDVEKFTSHCFITGSTGSGKSQTTYHILESMIALNIPFLAIEPVKGEYKNVFGKLPNINIFWTNTDYHSLLRINPFSFPSGIHVLEHMDRLIEIFKACWPLHNAMPAILKDAIQRSYVNCGWDLLNSRYFDTGKPMFPTFFDLLVNVRTVIDESKYSAQAKGDYTGALETRISSLTLGIMGQIFTSGLEISNAVLFDQNTIIDLSKAGSEENISLIMGIIIMKLREYRMTNASGTDSRLRHLTILEEAHNLLRRVSTEQRSDGANIAGKSVEMISNSIAEMRTYGEGFIIIDQSPSAVDVSAIKNTNTKIVMKLQDHTDIETAGHAFSLEPTQIGEIARLQQGVAIVSQSGWVEPVMTYVDYTKRRYKYKEGESAPLNDRCSVAFQFAKLVQKLALHEEKHDDGAIYDLLNSKTLSPSLHQELFQMYKQFLNLPPAVAKRQKHSFMVNVLGCKALPEIFPIPFTITNIDQAQADGLFVNWCVTKIFPALDNYASFDADPIKSNAEKAEVIMSVLWVMAYDDNIDRYKELINVLKPIRRWGRYL